MQRTRPILLSALAAIVFLSGCDVRVTAPPTYQTQVVNSRNDLAFQVTGLEDATVELQYSWINDGTAASVVQSPADLTGTATLFIRDGAGAQVYQRTLAENGTFATTAGVPGTWTVRVRFDEANGAVTLRVKNP